MFWENFSYLCAKENISPSTLAKKIGIKSSGTVSGWKRGALPRASALEDIAGYFGVSVKDLLSETPISEKKPTPLSENGLATHSCSFTGLTESEELALRAYHAGLLAARRH